MTESDDDFGRTVAGLLHDQEPELTGADLSGPTLARARVVRRRRRTVLAAGVLTAVVGSAAMIASGVGVHRLDTGPVAPTSAAPGPPSRSSEPGPTPPDPSTPPRLRTVNLDIDKLPTTSTSPADWVSKGVWHKADGTAVRIGVPTGADRAARFFALGDRLVAHQWSSAGLPSGEAVWLIAADGTKKPADFGPGLVPGPEGSLLWPAGKTIKRIDPDGRRTAYALPVRTSGGMVATSRAVFVTARGKVTRYAIDGRRLTEPMLVPGAEDVILGDPRSDQVVVRNRAYCTAILPASDLSAPHWECRYRAWAVSPDGGWAVTEDGERERAVLVDRAGQPRLILKHGIAEDAAVDAQGGVLLTASKPADDKADFFGIRSALVTCSSDGRCRRLSDIVDIVYNKGDRPLEIVRR